MFTLFVDHSFTENNFYFYYASFEQLEVNFLRFFTDRSIQLLSDKSCLMTEHVIGVDGGLGNKIIT